MCTPVAWNKFSISCRGSSSGTRDTGSNGNSDTGVASCQAPTPTPSVDLGETVVGWVLRDSEGRSALRHYALLPCTAVVLNSVVCVRCVCVCARA